MSNSFMTLPDSSIHCDGLAWAAGKLQPAFTDKGGTTKTYPYKAIYATVDGVVVVNPFFNADGANIPITATAGEFIGCPCNHIVEAGTNVPLANLYLIPDLSRVYGSGV